MEKNNHMTGIIDIHAHILPGVDDGADSWEEAEQMLLMAYQQGIRCIITTPHYHEHSKKKSPDEPVARLGTIAANIDKEFRVKAGFEIFYFDELVDALNTKEVLPLADSRYVLVEFSPEVPYQRIFQGIRKLVLARYIPILAHMERYRCLKKEGRIEELTRSGGLMQMNFGSIQGSWLRSDVRWCRRQLLQKKVHFLGTDMHGCIRRKPDITRALKWMERHMSRKACHQLLRDNPECILRNQILG